MYAGLVLTKVTTVQSLQITYFMILVFLLPTFFFPRKERTTLFTIK
jgi:hypothetical protein